MLEFLPEEVKRTLSKLRMETITEIRLRIGQPLVLKVLGEYVSIDYVGGYSLKSQDLFSTLLRLSEHSVYAHQETVKNGYITAKDGVRVGFCGDVVMGKDGVRYFGTLTSIVVSIPHEIYKIFDKSADTVFADGVTSLLILSEVGGGKTTLIREIARYASMRLRKNVLVCDERGEISLSSESMVLSSGVDCLRFADKSYACYHGVKSLRPDMICLDEIISESDAKGISFAKNSGVEIVASVHAKDLKSAAKKAFVCDLIKNKMFKYAIIIDKNTFNQQVVNLYD